MKRWSSAALNWLAAGYVADDANPFEPVALVKDAIARWAAEHCGDLPALQIGITVTCSPEVLGADYEYNDDEQPLSEALCAMAIHADGFDTCRVLEPRLTALETAHRGLGQTALHWLGRAIWNVEAGVVTPQVLRDRCVNHLWYGADSQEEFIAEFQAMNGDDEECDGLTPDVFDTGFPDWVIKPKEIVKLKQLQRIAGKKTEAGAVAKLLIELSTAMNRSVGFEPLREMYSVVASCALRWNSDDPTGQVIDDLDEYLGSSELATDQLSVMPVPLEPEQFKAWLDGTSLSLRIFNLLDQLIGLISVMEE